MAGSIPFARRDSAAWARSLTLGIKGDASYPSSWRLLCQMRHRGRCLLRLMLVGMVQNLRQPFVALPSLNSPQGVNLQKVACGSPARQGHIIRVCSWWPTRAVIWWRYADYDYADYLVSGRNRSPLEITPAKHLVSVRACLLSVQRVIGTCKTDQSKKWRPCVMVASRSRALAGRRTGHVLKQPWQDKSVSRLQMQKKQSDFPRFLKPA